MENYTDEDIRKAIIDLTKPPVTIFAAVVTAVRESEYTIDVKPVGRAEVLDVRLKAAIDSFKDGYVEIPKQNSTVLCGIINNDKTSCFVIKCSEVDKVLSFGGEQKGIPLHDKVKDNMVDIKGYCEALKTAVANALNAVGVGSAANGPAAMASFNAEMASQNIVLVNMENEKVIQ